MYTAPDYRGKGIATEMLNKLADEAKKRTIHKICLGASEFGRSVYRRFGFVESDAWMELNL